MHRIPRREKRAVSGFDVISEKLRHGKRKRMGFLRRGEPKTGTDREDALDDEVVELLERGVVRLVEGG